MTNPRALVLVVRAVVLGVCLGLAVLHMGLDLHPLSLAALLGVAVAVTLASTRPPSVWVPLVEAALAAAAITTAAPLEPYLLPYLIVPALEAGLLWGARAAVTTVGVAALVLLGVRASLVSVLESRDFFIAAAEWVAISLVVGLVAAWARRIRVRQLATASSSYAAAYRLLSQLRVVSRQLSGGLDAVSLAQALLEALRGTLHFTRAALYVRSEGGRLVPLAHAGVGRVDWIPMLDDDSAWAEAWTSGTPHRQNRTFSEGQGGYAAVLPLRVGVRVVGLVGLERLEAPFTQPQLEAATEVVDEAALRIETALLFSEVRQIATAEERRRLAREIHDGIAQELASLGYIMDDLSYRAPDDEQRESLQMLRGELTRIISELRLSIFDLRSEVQVGTGLGAALSDYVRAVGATSHLTVHLVLDESPQRLRTEAEAELLRIAQEAVTNVRKHSRARNLWVTCKTAPPNALLVVEDDGLGLGRGRADSYGMDIMRERATRLGASLSVSEREGGGTVVAVVLGAPDYRSVSAARAAGHQNPNTEGDPRVHDGAAR